jgi:hypothetical protein
MDQWELTPSFQQRLEQDGFISIGWYEIKEGNECEITVSHEASDWEFSIYTHVSFAEGGKHVRIGKCEGALKSRLNAWPRYIGDALKITMARNEQFKGGTPPWEAQGWLDYTVPYGRRGLLFARHGQILATVDETKKALRGSEKEMLDIYDPPLCNDTPAGSKLRRAWIDKHGSPVKRWKTRPNS